MNNLYILAVLCLFSGDNLTSYLADKPSDYKPTDLKIRNAFVAKTVDTLKYPPCNEDEIPHYNAYKVDTPIKIDGVLDESVWQDALLGTLSNMLMIKF